MAKNDRKDRPRPRLDEILIREGLISEAQLKEALSRQKAQGGKLGSQLLYHRYINEADLVTALATQLNCEGVVLSGLEIPDSLLRTVPKELAVARKLLPFDYDADEKLLKVACVDPTDETLIQELGYVVQRKDIKLYVAAELALNTAIARYYMGREVPTHQDFLLELPGESGGSLGPESPADPWGQAETLAQGNVLLVSDDQGTLPLVRSLLERDGYSVTTADSADDAIEQLGDNRYRSVLIRDTVPGDYIDLIDRLRKASPQTVVRYYGSASSLVLDEETVAGHADLLLGSLDLHTSLLSSMSGRTVNHAGRVGGYVDRLCRRIGLPDRERLLVTAAAYLHNLGGFYYQTEETQNDRATIKLTIKLLQSLNFSPVVIEMLRSMYIDLKGKYTRRLPIEVLGGNILTTVDLFCHGIPYDERLSLDKFHIFKRRLRDMTGQLFLKEVVAAFTGLVHEELLRAEPGTEVCQVMLYCSRPDLLRPLDLRLRNAGFRTVTGDSLDSLADLFQRSQPHLAVLALAGDRSEIAGLVDDLQTRGINIHRVPTFVMVDGPMTPDMTSLLEQGVEDIVSVDDNPDLLIAKLAKIRAQLLAEAGKSDVHDQPASSRGRLQDMSLIDLLQALGPSRKTVRIIVTSATDRSDQLVVYLDQGRISFAEYRGKLGAQAIYEAMAWAEGTWAVEPALPANLPEPNNDMSNESILMEGCRRLDERAKTSQPG